MAQPNANQNIDELINSLRVDHLIGRGTFEGIEDRTDKNDSNRHYYSLTIGKMKSEMTIVLTRDQYLEIRQKNIGGELKPGSYLQYKCEVSAVPKAVNIKRENSNDFNFVANELSQPRLIEYKL